jgi:N6-L-threonylcarbamoyladenine synthase
MLDSGDLDFSFSGLKTAVLTASKREPLTGARRADIAREFQHAVVDVLVAKALAALAHGGRERLVVAGGVGANRELRARLTAAVEARGGAVFYPPLEFCTDNGAMIALVGALRLAAAAIGGAAGEPRGRLAAAAETGAFGVRPRWDLDSLPAPG